MNLKYKKIIVIAVVVNLLLCIAICAVLLMKDKSDKFDLPETQENDMESELSESQEEQEDVIATATTATETSVQDTTEELTEDDTEQEIIENAVLKIEEDPAMYTYEDMISDASILSARYSDNFNVEILGKTFDGRDLYLFIVGDENAKHKVFVNAGIHAREYMTSQLVMKQMCLLLESIENNTSYDEYNVSELMEDTAVYFVPMVNPDGISLSQFGLEGIQNTATRERLEEIADMDGVTLSGEYLRNWKANANGVDLNRNFDALWDQYEGAGHASTERFKGEAPECEVESSAIATLTRENGFERTLSYHAMGSVIYWYFGQENFLYTQTENFAIRIGGATGYWLDANYEYLDPAGYKDWAIMQLGIPSLTIEIGSGEVPLAPEAFQDIWIRNQNVVLETLIDLLENK